MYYHNVTPIYSQTCIKRSSLDKKIEWPLKKGDLLKKAKFLWNFLWQHKKNVTF